MPDTTTPAPAPAGKFDIEEILSDLPKALTLYLKVKAAVAGVPSGSPLTAYAAALGVPEGTPAYDLLALVDTVKEQAKS